MKALPVIERELLAAARSPWTARMRLLFALAGLLACLIVLALPRMNPSDRGLLMLLWLGILSLSFALLSGCFLTADCISQEKREGTLGLLFLTPLRSRDVLLGKLVSNSLQVVYGLLAVFPVFFLPILNGGVSWGEVLRLLLALGITLLLSLSLGLFFSTFSTESKTPVLATFISILLITLIPLLYAGLESAIRGRSSALLGFPQVSPAVLLFSSLDQVSSRLGHRLYWGAATLQFLASIGLLGLCIRFLPRVWQQSKQPRRRRLNSRTRLSKRTVPLPANVNPYAWRTRRGAADPAWLRAVRGFMLLLIAVMLLLSGSPRNAEEAFITAFITAYALHFLTKLTMALEATRPLLDDRRSGALELILVTPVGAHCVMPGLHQSFLQSTRRPLALLALVNLALLATAFVFRQPLHMDAKVLTGFSVMFLGGIAAASLDRLVLAWIGFRQSLTAPTHLKAALTTLALTLVPSWLLFTLVVLGLSNAKQETTAIVCFASWHLVSLVLSVIMLAPTRRLVTRQFHELAAARPG